MDGRTQLLPGLTLEEEYAALEPLMKECIVFEDKWRVLRPLTSDASPDAVLAIHELRTLLVARRAYVLALLDQESIPF